MAVGVESCPAFVYAVVCVVEGEEVVHQFYSLNQGAFHVVDLIGGEAECFHDVLVDQECVFGDFSEDVEAFEVACSLAEDVSVQEAVVVYA